MQLVLIGNFHRRYPLKSVRAFLITLLLSVYTLWAATVFVAACLVIFIPAALLLPTVALRRQAGNITIRVFLLLCGIRLSVNGLDNLPSGGCIVVANHSSYIDGPILGAVLPPRFCLVIKREANQIPVVGFFLRRIDHQFVERTNPRGAARDAQQMIQRLRQGEEVGIFAEGTFVAAPGILPFKPGAFIGAIRSHVPVIPAAIRGTRHIFPANSMLIRPGTIRIQLLPAISTELGEESVREASRRIAEQARSSIAAVVEEPLV